MHLNKKGPALLALSLIVIFCLVLFAGGCAEETADSEKKDGYIILATTTSTYDSGLLDFLNPYFTEKTGIEVRVVSQGTGAALESGVRGDADALLVHDRASELQLVEEGAFINRHDVMYNDFIIVGPAGDPAGINNTEKVTDAFNLIADGGHTFVSRGDDSGTHRMEVRLWNDSGIDPAGRDWYLSVGQGMGDTLTVANETLGYTMTDRGTYTAMRDSLDLIIVLEGDPVLFNRYGVMAVNPDEHSHVKYDYAMKYIDFLMSEKGQDLISSYRVNEETLFFPGYGPE